MSSLLTSHVDETVLKDNVLEKYSLEKVWRDNQSKTWHKRNNSRSLKHAAFSIYIYIYIATTVSFKIIRYATTSEGVTGTAHILHEQYKKTFLTEKTILQKRNWHYAKTNTSVHEIQFKAEYIVVRVLGLTIKCWKSSKYDMATKLFRALLTRYLNS